MSPAHIPAEPTNAALEAFSASGLPARSGPYLRRLPGLGSRKLVLATVLTGIAYLAAARFGLSLAFTTKQVTPVWPPTGVAVAALFIFGFRIWPGVFAAALVANYLADESLATAAGIAVGNTVGPLLSVSILTRWGHFAVGLRRLRDVAWLALSASLGMMVTASNGVATLVAHGLVPASGVSSVWWVWWVGDTMGVLLFAPPLLTWLETPRPRQRPAAPWERVLLFAGVLLASEFAFSVGLLGLGGRSYHLYALFPFIAFAALRFGPRETSTVVLIVSCVAVWATVHDRGPFGAMVQHPEQRLILLEMFMSIASLTGLSLAAASAESERAALVLREANDELEARVGQRTLELASANRELSRKNEEVEAFVYIVSHDLRGPLVNLQGFSRELAASCAELREPLSAAPLPAETREKIRAILESDIPGALRYISASSDKFQRLIDALLALSRLGRQEYRSEPVDLGKLAHATVDSLQQLIDQSGARVTVADLPLVQGDATALGQVLANLVGNAIKYLRPGVPGLVEIGGKSAGSEIHLWVRDNGSGISESARPRLFQVFQRFHPELAGGDGMGLAIVKRVVERHGGRVWVESAVGSGSTFFVSLPCASARKE